MSSGASGPKCSRVSKKMSRTLNFKTFMSSGASGPKCSRVSKKCPESVPGVAQGASARRHSVGRLLGHPPFSVTRLGTLPGHFGPEAPKDSCSRSGGSQVLRSGRAPNSTETQKELPWQSKPKKGPKRKLHEFRPCL